MYHLYYSPRCASMAVHWLLHHLDVPYRLHYVNKKKDEQKSDAYRKLNPVGKIPTLVIDGQPIAETAAIMMTLCEKHPDEHMMPPTHSAQKPRFYQWMLYLSNTLQNDLMIYFYPARHGVHNTEHDNVKRTQAARIDESLTLINDQLSHHTYLIDDEIYACDFFLFMLCSWCFALEKTPMDYPYLRGFMQRMATNESVLAVNEIEQLNLIEILSYVS